MAADTQTLQYIITFKTMGVDQAKQAIEAFQRSVGAGETTYKKSSAASDGLMASIGKLAGRAALTIPIWTAMRFAFQETMKAMGDAARNIIEFDTAIRKMMAVSTQVANMPVFMKQLGKEVLTLSEETGRSIKDISQIYYQFAETGMKAADAQAGMNVALKLAIGTFGDVKDTARIMVDLYNMFGASMDSTLTPMQKMQSIGGTFVTLWKENSGNLGEYINALKMFAPIAKNYNLSMEDTLTMTVVLNNYMQRSTMGGTQLARAFQEMTKNVEKFEAAGIRVRGRSDWLNVFLETLKKINSTPTSEKGALVNQLFGERSAKGVSSLAATDALEKLVVQLEKVKNMTLEDKIKAITEAFDLQNRSLENQINVFGRLREQSLSAFFIGVMGANSYEEAIKNAGDALFELNKFIREILIPSLHLAGKLMNPLQYGANLGKALANKIMGRPNTKVDLTTPASTAAMAKSLGISANTLGGTEPGNEDNRLKTLTAQAQTLKALGYDSLQIEIEKARIMEEAGASDLEKKNQALLILTKQIELVNEYAGIIQGKLTNAFTDILSGTAGFSNIGKAINDALVEGYRKTVAEGLTNMVMATGLGDLFGSSMASVKGVFGGLSGKIEGAFDVGGKQTYNWIVRGFSDGMNSRATGGAGGGSAGIATFAGGAGGGIAAGLLSNGWFSQPALTGSQQMQYSGNNGGFSGITSYGTTGVNSGGTKGLTMSRGQVAYAGLQGAMTGYSAYQSARQSGSSQVGAIGGGIMTGLGAIAGGIAGGLAMSSVVGASLLGMGPIGWAVLAGALIVGGILMSSAGKKKQVQTSVETKTQVTELASKIDVSNKKLELINRNLVALRNTMETYIMPNSTYFSTARNLEDEFALSARRG